MRAHLLAALLAILSVIWEPHGADAIDVTGKWRFQATGGPPVITQVTQSGSTLSFTLGAFAFSGSLSAAGTFTDYDVGASSPVMAEMACRDAPPQGRRQPSSSIASTGATGRSCSPPSVPSSSERVSWWGRGRSPRQR